MCSTHCPRIKVPTLLWILLLLNHATVMLHLDFLNFTPNTDRFKHCATNVYIYCCTRPFIDTVEYAVCDNWSQTTTPVLLKPLLFVASKNAREFWCFLPLFRYSCARHLYRAVGKVTSTSNIDDLCLVNKRWMTGTPLSLTVVSDTLTLIMCVTFHKNYFAVLHYFFFVDDALVLGDSVS